MNAIYRSIWSESTGTWVAVSEVAKGKAKSSKSATLTAAAMLLGLSGTAGWAQTYTDPGTNNNTFQTTVAPAGVSTLSGTFNPGTPGHGPQSNFYNLMDAAAAGRYTFTPGPINATNYPSYWQQGNPPMDTTITVYDPISHANIVVSVASDSSLNAPPLSANQTFSQVVPNSANVYIAAGIGKVTTDGGALIVNIGDNVSSTNTAGNTLALTAKQTDLTYADGGIGLPSTILWNSKNYIHFDQTSQANPNAADTKYFVGTLYNPSFVITGTGSSLDGTQQSVKNPTDMQAYNDMLVGQLKAGKITVAQYQNALNQAVPQTVGGFTYNVWTDGAAHPTDSAVLPTGRLSVMYATGANATATLAAGGVLDVGGSNGGAMQADAGAHLVNNGQLSVVRDAYFLPPDIGMRMDGAGATGVNNGTLTAGALLDATGKRTGSTYWSSYGAMAMNGASFENSKTGVINAAFDQVGQAAAGISVSQTGSTAVNNGIINIIGGGAGSGIAGAGTDPTVANGGGYGATVGQSRVGSEVGPYTNYGGGSFINGADGTIYIGRSLQLKAGDPTTDVVINGGPELASMSAGINVSGPGSTATNLGNITVGSLVSNAAGILVQPGTSDFSAINAATGVINVHGGIGMAAPSANYGMYISDAAKGNGAGLVNNGVINIDGANNVGIKVLATTTPTEGISTGGAINVTGGIDPTSGTRNYGVWTEGQNGQLATVTVDSAIKLDGTGAIGVHARGSALVNVDANAVPSFGNTDQIGFYIYGSGAQINVKGAMTVDTDRSTLFRISRGAQFDGSGLILTASGVDSAAIVGTGVDDVTGVSADVHTNGATINVSAPGAKAVLIEGGATGDISANTTINLTVAGAVAGIVDGLKHDLTGAVVGNPVPTQLTAATRISGAVDGITGYIARNEGTLINSGTISLTGANSVGVSVEGGTLNNSSVINVTGAGSVGVDMKPGMLVKSTSVMNNTGTVNVGTLGIADITSVGVRASGSGAQITSLGTVNVVSGLAGVQLLNGAALTVSGSNNIITTDGMANGILLDIRAASLDASNIVITANGTGAGIENKAEIGTVKLTGVTINAKDGAAIRTATSFDPTSTATLNVTGSGTGIAF